jgi:hypothetical protein
MCVTYAKLFLNTLRCADWTWPLQEIINKFAGPEVGTTVYLKDPILGTESDRLPQRGPGDSGCFKLGQ